MGSHGLRGTVVPTLLKALTGRPDQGRKKLRTLNHGRSLVALSSPTTGAPE